MARTTKWLAGSALALTLVAFAGTPRAEAGNGFSLQIGGLGISNGYYGGFGTPVVAGYRGYGVPYTGSGLYRSGYRSIGSPLYYGRPVPYGYAPRVPVYRNPYGAGIGRFDCYRGGFPR
ncbi:MAG: hypothetical protein AAGD07_22600 [Planctomycetota bacterium]